MVDYQTDRGQTPFDFMLGFSIFVMAVVFTLMLAPGLITPFSGGQSGNPLFADRTADHLSESKLVESPSTTELDRTATDEFFSRSDAELHSELGVDDQTRVNVSIEGPEVNDAVGPQYPTDRDRVTVAQRKVTKDGELHRLYVRVW